MPLGPGVVWELAFGSWVLLQPERINGYAQAVIRTLQADELQRGCLMEERLLKGDLAYEFSKPRLAGDEERFVLLAMHQTLVGEVISTVALADQISREFNVSDQGIDMEIEFTDDAHEAAGEKLYLQLKSGDSYLRERKGDSAEIFTIKDERHARYWMAQAFPVLLVIRNVEGEIRWMEVRDWLKRASDNGKKSVKQVVFDGERFDVMSVRRWRDKALSRGLS